MNLLEKLKQIKNETNVVETFRKGEKNCEFIIYDVDGSSLIMKYSDSKEGIEEINENILGYKLSKKYPSLKKIFPNIVETNEKYIVLEYLGEPIKTKNISQFEVLSAIKNTINSVYKTKIRSIDENKEAIKYIINHETSYLEKFLLPNNFGNKEMVKDLNNLDFSFVNSSSTICTKDFTPDNVFIYNNGFKYIDPKRNIIGPPFIDLGMLGTSYDKIYQMSENKDFYNSLLSFSKSNDKQMNYVGEETERLFKLGSLRQYILSAKFGLFPQNNPTKVNYCINQAKKIIEELK